MRRNATRLPSAQYEGMIKIRGRANRPNVGGNSRTCRSLSTRATQSLLKHPSRSTPTVAEIPLLRAEVQNTISRRCTVMIQQTLAFIRRATLATMVTCSVPDKSKPELSGIWSERHCSNLWTCECASTCAAICKGFEGNHLDAFAIRFFILIFAHLHSFLCTRA